MKQGTKGAGAEVLEDRRRRRSGGWKDECPASRLGVVHSSSGSVCTPHKAECSAW